MIHPLAGLSGGSDFSNSNGSGRGRGKGKKKEVKECFVRKYSTGMPLAEQIILGGRRSMFLQIIDGKPVLKDSIDLSQEKGMILKPHQTIGSTPAIIEHEYNDLREIEHFIDLASRMDIDTWYFLTKSIWQDVVATKEKELIVLLAADTIMSFFQDLFVTTHYVLLTGPPGWGKGAILVAFKLLAYRVILAGDMSGANLLDLLGSMERCQVSVAEDEFDRIEEDPDKQRIYKMGYEDIGLVTRTVDPSSSDRALRFYNPYCIKIFGSEKGPDSKELGGFNDRVFRSEVRMGRPKLLIKEIKKQMERPLDKQLPKYRRIVSRINFLRKLSLVYRLLHHGDTIEEVPLNIYGRALELCGPVIRLFNSDNLAHPDRKALAEIMDALTYFLRKKGELDKKTIEVVIYDVLKDLFDQIDKEEEAPGTSTILTTDSCRKEIHKNIHGSTETSYVITYDEICNRVMKEVEGSLITPRTFESPDYDRITHDSLLAKCRAVFEGKNTNIGTGKDKKRALAFNKDAVTKAGETFDVISEIKILDGDEEATHEDSEDNKMWDEWTGGTNGNAGTKGQFSGQYRGKGQHNDDENGDSRDSQDPYTDDEKTTKVEGPSTNNSNVTSETADDQAADPSIYPSKTEKFVLLSQKPKITLKNESKSWDKSGTNITESAVDDEPPWQVGTPEQAKAFNERVERLQKEKRKEEA